jgi:hypothetical protein
LLEASKAENNKWIIADLTPASQNYSEKLFAVNQIPEGIWQISSLVMKSIKLLSISKSLSNKNVLLYNYGIPLNVSRSYSFRPSCIKGFGKVGFGNKPSAFVILLSFLFWPYKYKRYGQYQEERILFLTLSKPGR